MADEAEQQDTEEEDALDAPDEPEADGGEDGETEEGGAETKKRGLSRFIPSRKIMIFGLAGLVLLGGAGYGGWMMFGPTPAQDNKPAAAKAVFYDLPEITVNLGTVDARAQYLKVRIALEVSDRETLEEISPLMPRVVDTFQVFLRELRVADLEGSAGVYRLKEELRRRVNTAVYPAQVNDVLFKEMLVQ